MNPQTRRKRPVAWKLLDEDSELIRVPIKELSPDLLNLPSCFEVHGYDNVIAVCPSCGAYRDQHGFIIHRKLEDWSL
jgi:hypothetical protein